jgi:hypothetical protein
MLRKCRYVVEEGEFRLWNFVGPGQSTAEFIREHEAPRFKPAVMRLWDAAVQEANVYGTLLQTSSNAQQVQEKLRALRHQVRSQLRCYSFALIDTFPE